MYQENQTAIETAIASFPKEFGLRAFPGDVFRISQRNSYMPTNGPVMLVTQVLRGDVFMDFSKCTPSELKDEIRPVPVPVLPEPVAPVAPTSAEVRHAAEVIVMAYAHHKRETRGDEFITASELESLASDPLGNLALLGGEDAYRLLGLLLCY